MAPRQHRFVVSLSTEAEVAVRYTVNEGEVEGYSVVLVLRENGAQHAVRLYDNAHDEQHMHRYTREGGKQDAEKFHDGTAGEALPAAIEQIKATWTEMIDSWRR